MAKKPPVVQLLVHGRLLCREAFRFFVDTWNWLVCAVPNLRGDWDSDPNLGHIHVDWTDSEHPTVHFVRNGLGGGTAPLASAYDIDWATGNLVRRFANVGGVTFCDDAAGEAVDVRGHFGFVALRVEPNKPDGQNILFFDSLAELVEEQRKVSHFTKALYYLGGDRRKPDPETGELPEEQPPLSRADVVDLRNAPTSIVFETLLNPEPEPEPEPEVQ